MSLPPGDVAKVLYDAIGPEAFAIVSEWLTDVSAEHALGLEDGRVVSPNVSWLADAVVFYDPGKGS